MTKIPEASPPSLADGSAPVKCIACGYGNSAADASCQACGSSLGLQLCSACEAINGMKAERCHACGAPFAAPVGNRMVPVAMTHTIRTPRRSGRRALALFGVLLLTAALAYRYYGDLLAPALQATLAALNARAPEPAAQRATQIEPALRPRAAVAEAPARGAPTKTAAKRAPEAVAAKRAPEAVAAKQATRMAIAPPADTPAVPRAGRAAAPSRAPASGSTALVEANESAKHGSGLVGVSNSSPQLGMVHARVTHTKTVPDDATVPMGSVVARPATVSNGCSEAIAALDLCADHEKGEGK